MKKILLTLALAYTAIGFSQAITVNTNTYTIPQLVNTVLINSPCVSATNITSQTGSNFGSSNGIGFFQNTNPAFPMQSGVILSTGDVNHAVGPNTTMLNDGAMNWPGDANLESTLASAGIAMNSVNATILEFDFTPISPTFSFDFLFASEEYGNFQCQFSDAFAFLLTNTVTGVTTNLAVVPGTNLPISVVTIRDFLYNSSCPSANAQYFGSYNGGSAAATAAVNFNGQTKLMNASAVLTPNTLYHIKLVIADRSDEGSDSAIFISSDTFNIGQDVLGQDVTATSPLSPCFGDTYVLDSHLSPTDYTFTWTRNGQPVVGQTGPTLSITQSGTYGITYQKTLNGCQPITDFVTVTYQPEIISGTPSNLYRCNTGATTYTYDISRNTYVIKVGMDPATEVTYYATAAAANAGLTSNILPYIYTSAPGTTIYVRIKNHNNNCFIVKTFQLLTSAPPVAHQPGNITKCAASVFGNSYFDFVAQTPIILGSQTALMYTVSYYATAANANNGTNPITYTYATDNTTIYVRVQSTFDNTCYDTTSFVLHITPRPEVDVLEPVVVCDPYVLPHLTNGHYFTGPGGTLTALNEGDVITATQTIYIFNQPNGPSGCTASSSFLVTVLDPMTMTPGSQTSCGNYTLPSLANGHYYTGLNGTGTQLHVGDVLTSSQTVYVYFQSIIPPFCILSPGFDVTIVPSVAIDTLPNVFDCSSYTLPALTVGNYFTLPDGGGTPLHAGDVLTTSQSVYIFASSSNGCTSQTSFSVVIGIAVPTDVDQCQPFTLPILPVGNYYTGPHGTGTQIAGGTSINLTQTVYIYVTSSTPNCTDDLHFSISISQPIIDDLADVSVCESYVLPELTSGEYFTSGNGTGTQLHAGDVITHTQTVFIFKRSTIDAGCANETTFNVTINPKPAIDSRSDIDVCNSYVLTNLAIGNYYTGPNGTGTMLPGGTTINTSQRIYIYAVSPTPPFCTTENSFNITIYSIEADAPANVIACDHYTLPALTIGNYYAAPNGPHSGEGNLMHAGDVISTTQTIYVYTESGERINCTDENTFTVTINTTPIVAPVHNINSCSSYTLPHLTVGNYFTATNGGGTQLNEGAILTTSQTIYVYAETATTPNCSDEKSFTVNLFQVDVLPNVTTCENFTLPQLTVGNYYTGATGTGTQLHTGQVINSSQTVYIYAVSPFSPTCYAESSFVLTIVNTPIAHPVPASMTTVCDEDGTNDGITSFDLTSLNATILGNQTGSEFTVSYYESLGDATAGTNPITATNLTQVYAKVSNTLTAHCYDVKNFAILVNKLPEPQPVAGMICYNSKTNTLLNGYTIPSGLTLATHTFQWFDADGNIIGTGSSYEAVAPGDYTVVATNRATGCTSVPAPVTIWSSEPAIVSYNITDDFSDNMVISVVAEGVGGDYEYQLDEGPFQDSPTFQGVSSGEHVITVRDKNGCGISTSQALVVNYPKFFTPNGDGYNDTWNIFDLKSKSKAVISIFDRYGKLIRQISPKGTGWDGTFSGQSLPSDDYWFTVSYEEAGVPKEFKSHFTMKR